MNRLLKFTAVLESVTGLALMAVPDVVVRLLLGGELTGAGMPLGRVAGFALLSLGIACWPPRDRAAETHAASRAMLAYNALIAAYLLWLGIRGGSTGLLLWPAVVLHGGITLLLVNQWRP